MFLGLYRSMHPTLIQIIDSSFDLFLPRKWQARLGGHLLRRARGEGNSNWRTNGEARLMQRFKRNYLSKVAAPVIVDVGANVGEWSAEALQELPVSTKLYGFEPSKKTFQRLNENLEPLQTKASIQTYNFGLSDSAGDATMYCTEELAGTNSLFRGHIETFKWPQAGEERVELQVGDDVATRLGIDRVDLLKIDTEGNELAVMRGFKRMFAEKRITCVQFEYGYCWIDSEGLLKHVFELLEPHGYRIGKICPWGVEFFDRYHHNEETFSFANYVACLPEVSKNV